MEGEADKEVSFPTVIQLKGKIAYHSIEMKMNQVNERVTTGLTFMDENKADKKSENLVRYAL